MTTRIHISAHQKAILRHITRYGFITPREARAIVRGVDPKIGAYVRRKKSKRDRRPAWAQVQALPLGKNETPRMKRRRLSNAVSASATRSLTRLLRRGLIVRTTRGYENKGVTVKPRSR
jgi:hypothetical protein